MCTVCIIEFFLHDELIKFIFRSTSHPTFKETQFKKYEQYFFLNVIKFHHGCVIQQLTTHSELKYARAREFFK